MVWMSVKNKPSKQSAMDFSEGSIIKFIRSKNLNEIPIIQLPELTEAEKEYFKPFMDMDEKNKGSEK
jgi:hypothetical protein